MPPDLSPAHLATAFLVAVLGGGINSIAAGGTLLTYPVLVALGVHPAIANATCAVGFLPSAVSSMWGYRDELRGAGRWVLRITVPALVGGAIGALVFLRTPPDAFARIVPFLVLVATGIFMAQNALMRRAGIRADRVTEPAAEPVNLDPHPPPIRFLAGQFAISLYGGYFGAGVGILMLAGLGFVGFTNIHRMNGLRNWATVCMNALASTMFVVTGLVYWRAAVAIAVGGIVGGYAASRLAQRVPQRNVRRAVVGVGLVSFIFLLLRPL